MKSRVHLLQMWYRLSDLAMEDAPTKVSTMHRSANIELINFRIPDDTMILTLRHLLKKHERREQIFESVKAHLSGRNMTKRYAKIDNGTLIAGPMSKKNKAGKRNPQMYQAKKG